MFNATCLYRFWWRKKKAKQFIIPPIYFKNNSYNIVEVVKPIAVNNENIISKAETEIAETKPTESAVIEEKPLLSETPKTEIQNSDQKVSKLSLNSIKAVAALKEANNAVVKDTVYLPNETFTETEMLIFWDKYAQRLSDKGHKIMESLLQINKPKLIDNLIIHELPNEGSKIDFETEKHELLQYLRSHLKNHELSIRVDVNEVVSQKFAFTDQDKYERLLNLNPNLELLKKTFDLDF